nr:MAG TPA: hypothetical protein [Caudoviricetes sp.]DAQ93957.1 MAG TPA: hypothetical protein [Caudoviricetes sp.]
MESYDTYFVQLRCEASTRKVGAFFMPKHNRTDRVIKCRKY